MGDRFACVFGLVLALHGCAEEPAVEDGGDSVMDSGVDMTDAAVGLDGGPGDASSAPACGDGRIDPGEACEPGMLGGATCGSLVSPGWVGTVSCGAAGGPDACQYDTSECVELAEDAYYVAPDGDDSNPGTLEQPWRTWARAVDAVAPGDVVYFREGVHAVTERLRTRLEGTEAAPITFSNYPGESPIFDCGEVMGVTCVEFDRSSHLVFRGLTLRNFLQRTPDDDLYGGFSITRSHHIVVESCTVHDVGAPCFRSSDNDELYYIDCDAYDCVDHLTRELPGNDGTGFVDGTPIVGDPTGRVYYRNCRAWGCGDQGFSSGSLAFTQYEGCWSFDNGRLEGRGHGFKMGWVPDTSAGVLNRVYRNNIAADNRRRGWDSNDQTYESGDLLTYNNFAFHNACTDPSDPECSNRSHGFYIFNTVSDDADELDREFYNNASLDNEDGEVGVGTGAVYTHSHNSWDSASVTIDASDFVSLDTDQLRRPRNPDGSLPEITFGRLSPESDLIDAGRVVPGHHCSTAGSHPEDDCVEWFGAAPDIGPFEHVE